MTAKDAPALSDVEVLSALGDATRRKLYEVVAQAGDPVGRDKAAALAGIARSLAAYHLDKLAEHGLLAVSYARPEGRSGPGAGRPAKLYRRADRDFVFLTPPRDYPLLAEILLRATEEAADPELAAAIGRAARKVGEEIGRAARPAPPFDVLRERGYAPFNSDERTLRFRNCPFHAAAAEHRGPVCGLNVLLVQGILQGLGTRGLKAVLEPGQAACCVAVRTTR
jgi:predicted ArsR family transcriptional regulator